MKLVTSTSEKQGFSEAHYLLWETHTGEFVESSVLQIYGRSIQWVICLPSSVGCSLGCKICSMPVRTSPSDLSEDNLWDIFERSMDLVGEKSPFQVSFMGQGEPFLNIKNVFGFCEQLCQEHPRVIIGISTVGIASGIHELATKKWGERVKLQISLHAWPASKRKRIIPAEQFYPVEEALTESIFFAKRCGKQCCLNCVLLDRINDSRDDAQRLAQVASRGPFYVKISEFNPNKQCGYRPAPETRVREYCKVLKANNIEVHRFKSIGTSIGAGCGQTKLGRTEFEHRKDAGCCCPVLQSGVESMVNE